MTASPMLCGFLISLPIKEAPSCAWPIVMGACCPTGSRTQWEEGAWMPEAALNYSMLSVSVFHLQRWNKMKGWTLAHTGARFNYHMWASCKCSSVCFPWKKPCLKLECSQDLTPTEYLGQGDSGCLLASILLSVNEISWEMYVQIALNFYRKPRNTQHFALRSDFLAFTIGIGMLKVKFFPCGDIL